MDTLLSLDDGKLHQERQVQKYAVMKAEREAKKVGEKRDKPEESAGNQDEDFYEPDGE